MKLLLVLLLVGLSAAKSIEENKRSGRWYGGGGAQAQAQAQAQAGGFGGYGLKRREIIDDEETEEKLGNEADDVMEKEISGTYFRSGGAQSWSGTECGSWSARF